MRTWAANEIWLSYDVSEYRASDAVTWRRSIDFTVSSAKHRLLWLRKRRLSSSKPARARCGHYCANRSNYASDSIRKWDGLCDIWTRLIYLRNRCRKQCQSCILRIGSLGIVSKMSDYIGRSIKLCFADAYNMQLGLAFIEASLAILLSQSVDNNHSWHRFYTYIIIKLTNIHKYILTTCCYITE